LSKIYISPYGVGLGHASRMLMVAEQIRALGYEVSFSSFGEAADFLGNRGFFCERVPPLDLSWTSEGAFSLKKSIASLPYHFVNFSKQLNAEIRNITAYRPDLIMADTRLSPLITSKFFDTPSLVVLNQIKLLLSPALQKIKIARLYEEINGQLLGALWSLADKILIPDLPPPMTICEKNIWSVNTTSRKIKYVGFTAPKPTIVPERLRETRQMLHLDDKTPLFFIHISGPEPTRKPLIKLALRTFKDLQPEIQYVISEGKPGGISQAQKISTSGWYFEWCPIRDELFSLCDALVIRAGHAAISQSIQFGKPFLSIPIENHGEQLANSDKVSELKIGISLKPQDITLGSFKRGVMSLLRDDQYKKNASHLMNIANELDGVQNIVKEIGSYLQ
jgi:UDP-N-acetylglucosamine--N-acetylmuramyl-(pentapeptide) pyrophosphoryl-undecaprenol N-acetylglucosamine transferase